MDRVNVSDLMGSGNLVPAGRVGQAGEAELGRGLPRRDLHSSQKGGDAVGPTRKGKGTKLAIIVDGEGTPLGALISSASPSEVKLAEPVLETVKVPRKGRGRPRTQLTRLIADRGYDSHKLRTAMRARGIDFIAPPRSTTTRKVFDLRKLPRYQRRWTVERTFGWLNHFKRLQSRCDRLLDVFAAWVYLAFVMVTLNALARL